MGGRLCLFLSAWQSITQDPFILSVIAHGFRISVSPDFPGVLRKVTKPLRSLEAHRSVLEEISSLITKQAIVQVSDSPALSLSPIFVIPKRSGGLRVILNLKAINIFIPPQHFRMETLASILPTISPQDWAVSLDLRDAYLHVPIHPVSRRLLGFQYQNRTFQYQVLPFGLRDSPWVFTRLVAAAGRSPSLPGNSDSSLPRRLAYSSLISGSPPVTSTGGTSVLPVSRLPDQLGE